MPLRASPLAVTGCIAAAAALAGYYAVRASAWAVMTDELQVARLATSIAERLSPVPVIHGVYYGALSQLYPLLIAPFYGSLSAPQAETAAHALNAVLLASAAWPAYLLARSVGASPTAGLVAAALTAFTPWLVLASTLLTENAAYPAFVWAVYLCHRAIAAPSAGTDAGALAGLALAFLARTQLLVLAVALPLAVVLHEVARREGGARAASLRALRQHRLLGIAYVLGLVACGALAVTGSLGSVVGNYATPFRGELVPPGFWHAAVEHFDQVAVGAGVLPVALAASWALTALVRPDHRDGHAFAALFVLLVPMLTFEVTSFDLRFTPHRFVQDRYLVYLVPLFAVGAGAWLAQRTRRTFRLAALALVAGALATVLAFGSYDERTVIFWASPAGAFHPALSAAAGAFGLPADVFVCLATVMAAGLCAAAAWSVPRAAMVGSAISVAGFGAFEAAYVLDRYADPVMTRPPAGAARGWIDRAVPDSRSVALVPSLHDAPTYWWEAEFWNKDVDRVLRVGSGRTYTPFPADRVSVDFAAGTLRGPQPSAYLVVSPNETRFRLRETAAIADGRPLRLVRVQRPYRLQWATRGVTADGWTRPGRTATVRLYGHGRPGRRTVTLTLAASRFAAKPLEFTFRSGAAVVRGGVDPGGARPPVSLSVCVQAGGHADATITTRGAQRLPDARVVALHLEGVDVDAAGPCSA